VSRLAVWGRLTMPCSQDQLWWDSLRPSMCAIPPPSAQVSVTVRREFKEETGNLSDPAEILKFDQLTAELFATGDDASANLAPASPLLNATLLPARPHVLRAHPHPSWYSRVTVCFNVIRGLTLTPILPFQERTSTEAMLTTHATQTMRGRRLRPSIFIAHES
jgi:hypothetical protein